MMEFEEMQKIWNEQQGDTMYAINENALHRSVTRKKDAISRRMNRVEIRGSLINGIIAIYLFILALQDGHNFIFISSGLLAGTVFYLQYLRWKRKKAEKKFDRSILGELNHAISNTNFIIRFNYFMIFGYLIPMFVLAISQMIIRGSSWEKWLIITGALLLALFLVRREQKASNLPGKKELLKLRKNLL